MASIADLFFAFRGEDKELIVDAQRAGDKAGMTMGQRASVAFGVAAKAGLALASGAFALASKGALELEDATARWRAETGATAEEAEHVRGVINRVAGDEQMSLQAVADIAIKVRKDLGAVGPVADQLTAKVAKFARVTRQDGAAAVADFDDILDNWGLEAEDMDELLDKLLVSNQRFGGDIAQNQKTLAGLAPALRAANFEIDDAIELLGLFGSKGLDANQGAAAFAKALTKVESPEELKALIADIAATEDPFARATKAADLFGARAGAKLANALGGANLDDYAISAEDAADATEKAVDVLDSSLGARLKKIMSQAGAALRGFGTDVGPVLTGLASLASLSGALGLDKILAKGFEKIGGSALVKAAVTKSGALIGLLFWGAVSAVDKAASLLASAFTKIPGSSAVQKAATAAGTALGGRFGGALKIGLLAVALGILAELWDTFQAQLEERKAQFNQIGADVANQIVSGTTEQLQQSKAALEQGIGDAGFFDFLLGSKDGGIAGPLKDQLALVDAELERRAAGLPPTVANAVAAGADTVEAGAEAGLSDPILDVAAGIPKAAAEEVKPTAREIADSLRGGRFRVKDATDALKQAFKDAISPTKEIARIEGFLSGKALNKALHSNKPEVRAEAQAWKEAAEERLFALRNHVPEIALDTGRDYATALGATIPDSTKAAGRIADGVAGRLDLLNLHDEGRNAGEDFADGLASQAQKAARAAARIAAAVASMLQFGSPTKAGPFSTKGGPEGWARIGALDFAAGWASADTLLGRTAAGLAGTVAGNLGLPSLSARPSGAMASASSTDGLRAGLERVASGGGDTYQNTWIMPEATRDPFAVLDRTARYVRWGRLRAEPAGG